MKQKKTEENREKKGKESIETGALISKTESVH